MDLTTFVQRATGGMTHDKKRVLKPSLFYNLAKDPYTVWCDYHAPESAKVDEPDRYGDQLMAWGSAFEEEWTRRHYPEAVEIRAYWGIEGLKETARAMMAGARAIHAPLLWALSEEVAGKGDVIVRCDDAPSDLGGWHYRVTEVKRSDKLRDYQALQAAVYNRILGLLQGYRPATFDVALKSEVVTLLADDWDEMLDRSILLWRDLRDNVVTPDTPAYNEAESPWRIYTRSLLEERRDLTLCPVIHRPPRRSALQRRLGIARVEEMERLEMKDFQKAFGPVEGVRTWYRYFAWKTKQPFVIPDARPVITRRKRHFYFDFETCNEKHPTVPPHIYMTGVFCQERDEFRVFVARGADEEAKAFAEFLDYVGDPADAVLYHWHSFETDEMKKLAGKLPRLAGRIERIVASCVDLKETLKNRVFFPTATYSIKEVAPAIGFRWKQEDVDAFESMMLYWEWIGDGDTAKIDRVIQYNKDDCMAMVHIDRAVSAFMERS